MKEMGKQFDDEEKLENALADFQEKFWEAPRKDLKGKSPNQAVKKDSEVQALLDGLLGYKNIKSCQADEDGIVILGLASKSF